MYFSKAARRRNRSNRRDFELSKTKCNQAKVNFDYDLMVGLLMRGSKAEFISYANACGMQIDWIATTWNAYREDAIKDGNISI